MTAEAAFSSTARDSQGNLHTIRGDNYEEFSANVVRALGNDAGGSYLATFNAAFGGNAVQGAVANLAAQGVVAAPPSTVGQPLPQPGVAAPLAAPALPPTAPAAPGNGTCAHGLAWSYKNTAGKHGPWERWECGIPWSKDAVGRCANVKISG
jgi:hypothetical protein